MYVEDICQFYAIICPQGHLTLPTITGNTRSKERSAGEGCHSRLSYAFVMLRQNHLFVPISPTMFNTSEESTRAEFHMVEEAFFIPVWMPLALKEREVVGRRSPKAGPLRRIA